MEIVLAVHGWHGVLAEYQSGFQPNDGRFGFVEATGGERTQNLRALIGSTDSTTNRIGFAAAAKVENFGYTYSVLGVSNTAGIPSDRVNHATLVKRDDGADPHTLQPYIVCYMWKRTA